ncbi:REP-associated tyrosine transposase [Bermanella sp. R86510]|uniref:REP-associated tyrosine transposase n=1 Tax=unclassified Bermanella TaxID=2627862 RepID=UPI0037C7D758
MAIYRRNFQPGGTFFFTVNLKNRNSSLLTDNINLLRESVRKVLSASPFHIDAWVVLPEHMHAMWTLPVNDMDYAWRWRAIKRYFSTGLPIIENRTALQMNRNERNIWQQRYWEHTIRNARDYEHHLNYIHINPLKHGHVNQVRDWPYSSFHRYVKKGVYPESWAGSGFIESKRSQYGE